MYAFALKTQRAVEDVRRHDSSRHLCLFLLALLHYDRRVLGVLLCCAGPTALCSTCSRWSTTKHASSGAGCACCVVRAEASRCISKQRVLLYYELESISYRCVHKRDTYIDFSVCVFPLQIGVGILTLKVAREVPQHVQQCTW